MMQVPTVGVHVVLAVSREHICPCEGWIEVYTELLLLQSSRCQWACFTGYYDIWSRRLL